MSNELDELLKIREVCLFDDSLQLSTHNKKMGWDGVALFFTNGQDMIRVYEGNSNGLNDKDIPFEEFIKNYSYKVTKSE